MPIEKPAKTLQAAFYVSGAGKRPVQEWLMAMTVEDRRTIGEDIATLEFCWRVGQPKCAAMKGVRGLYEIRSNLSSGRIARVFFVLIGNRMVLLHGFIKKSRKTPDKELKVAIASMSEVQRCE